MNCAEHTKMSRIAHFFGIGLVFCVSLKYTTLCRIHALCHCVGVLALDKSHLQLQHPHIFVLSTIFFTV